MKLSNIAFAALATSAAAIPHGLQARPNPVRRDPAAVTTAIVDYERAVLYVDQNGNRVATSMVPVDYAEAQPTVNAADSGSTFEEPSPYEPAVSEAVSTTPSTTASYSTPTETSSSSGDDSQETSGDATGYSIAYSPYNADHSCKSADQIQQDMKQLANYGMVRIYGTDCEQVPTIFAAAQANDQKLWAGIWHLDQAADEASIIVDAAKDDWDRIVAVSVGNELPGSTSTKAIVEGIGAARSVLQGGGYEGDVTTVDVWITLQERLNDTSNGLCDAIDIIAANCHPFFDAKTSAESASQFVMDHCMALAEQCNGSKEVVITESGWPSEGPTNGVAVPGSTEQSRVISDLRSSFADKKGQLVLFSAYNDPWKPDNGYGVEAYWGIYGNAPSAR